MTTFSRIVAFICLPCLLAVPAWAVNTINVQTFNPSTSDHFVFLEDGFSSGMPKNATYYFGANYNYMDSPLVALDSSQSNRLFTIIQSVQTLDLFFGFKLANSVGLFVGAPVHYLSYANTTSPTFPAGTATAFGDVKIEAKIRVTDDDSPTSIAFIPEVHIPTGSTQNFVTDASPYVGIRAALERKFDNFTLIGNLGFGAASNAIYQDATFASGIDFRKRFVMGIGGFLPFTSEWGMNLEFSNVNTVPLDKTLNPNDAYIGLRYVATENLIFTGGGSIGKIGGPTGSDYRMVAGVRYTLHETPTPAPTPFPMPTPKPTPVIIDSAPHATMVAERIEISTPIHFENNSYKLLPDSKQILDDVATLMLRNTTSYKKVLVDGHTSGSGTDEYNLKLSFARSRSVKSYLISKGVPKVVLEARGFGKRQPKVPHTSPGADELNRRVEFNIVK